MVKQTGQATLDKLQRSRSTTSQGCLTTSTFEQQRRLQHSQVTHRSSGKVDVSRQPDPVLLRTSL